MNHTKGPWQAISEMPESFSIQSVEGKLIALTQCDEDYNSENPITKAEESANAALIAAAPELLESLASAKEEIATIISILDGRMNTEFVKTDLGKRLASWFLKNAFLNDTIQKTIDKATT